MKNEAFYATAAQVLPLVLLALIVELRLQTRDEDEPVGLSLALIGVFASLVLGELFCVNALYEEQEPSRWEKAVILLGITIGLGMLAVVPIGWRLRAVGERMPRPVRVAGGLLPLAVGVLAWLAALNVIPVHVLSDVAAIGVLFVALIGGAILAFRRESR